MNISRNKTDPLTILSAQLFAFLKTKKRRNRLIMKNIVYIFLISMLPLIELRGAIPVGAALGVEFYYNYIVAVAGNLLPVPFILLFIPKILEFLNRFKPFQPIVAWLWKKADKHSEKVVGKSEVKDVESVSEAEISYDVNAEKKSSFVGIFIGLLTFVLIPLPGTGAWTGALVAALFKLPFWRSLLAIVLGVIGCGVIMCLASYGVVGFLSFLL